MSRPSTTELPTGEQWVIAHGEQQVVVTEVGSTLREYSVAGQPVIDGFEASEWSHGGRGQVLAPWPNRLGDGRYRFGDRDGTAALDEPEHHNAIHGLVRWLPWHAVSKAQNVLVTECLLHPTPGYPFTITLANEYRLGREGLVMVTTVTNVGDVVAPFGLGFHPYFTVGPGPVDRWQLVLPAARWLPTDQRGLPSGDPQPVAGTDLDFGQPRAVGPSRLDTAYTDLLRGDDGLARLQLRHPDTGQSVEVWLDDQYRHVMCFTGDTLPEGERRLSMALEPMTCPPDALRSGVDLKVLEPGTRWVGRWGINPSRTAPG